MQKRNVATRLHKKCYFSKFVPLFRVDAYSRIRTGVIPATGPKDPTPHYEHRKTAMKVKQSYSIFPSIETLAIDFTILRQVYDQSKSTEKYSESDSEKYY